VTLRPGKLPGDVLASLLARLPSRDSRVLLGPGIGRDAAVIDLGDRALVLKSDPVTFAARDAGWHAVHVNANDVACMGARPAWFLATALLPAGAPDTLPGELFHDLAAACEALGVELVGGHTEVTDVPRPMIAGTMAGEAARDELVLGEGITPGDVVVLTKAIAIEGTALLARDRAETLAARGVPAAAIARGQALARAPGISIVADARAITGAAQPRLLHDPTEGGVTTALYELAAAARATLRVDVEAIPVLEETRMICASLGLDPLGLLASGALLGIVAEEDAGRVAAACREAGIDCCAIGRVEGGEARVIMHGIEPAVPLRSFARDELARFFDADADD